MWNSVDGKVIAIISLDDVLLTWVPSVANDLTLQKGKQEEKTGCPYDCYTLSGDISRKEICRGIYCCLTFKSFYNLQV